MSEIAKCPFCGEEPAQVDHGWNSTCDFYECCGVLAEEEKWNKVAAAMNYAMAEDWYMETEHFNWSGPTRNEVAFRDWSAVNYCAGKELDSARQRVLKVFGEKV